MSSSRKLTILITGCSPGGMGAALAIAFHGAGHHVYATARNPSKLEPLAAQSIKTLALDVTSASSIASAVSSVSSSLPDSKGLDMLINNAAGIYTMPIADVSLDAARELFDVNVWSHIAVTQAFLPLLLKSTASSTGGLPAQAMIVNHTSVGSVTALPFQGIYNSSKAALAMLTETMRLELAPFGISVVDLKTAGVRTNIISNNNVNANAERLPEGSIYAPAREVVEKAMSQDELRERGITAEQWAAEVSALLLGRNPPTVIWRGESALLARVASMLPAGWFGGMIKKMTKLDVVEEIIKESRR
jgi:1-acylglycerone phosphate reductase